jgi:two-component system cell cycle response regulator
MQAMRGGIRCCIVEAFPGSLTGLAELLAESGLSCRQLGADAGDEELRAEPVDVYLGDTGSHAALGVLRRLATQRRAGGSPVIALCRRDAPAAISQALAIGCDDALAFPLEQVELEVRIRALGAYVFAERERGRRLTLLARYAAPERSRRRELRERPEERPQVLLVGPACENQVRIANGLGPVTVAYADSARAARRLLDERAFDLVVVTLAGPGAAPVLRPAELGRSDEIRGFSMLLGGPMADAAGVAAGLADGFDDVVTLPQLPELIRLRLDFWLRLQRIRQWLHDPLAGGSATLALDSLSGLYNEGFLRDYISAALDSRPAGAPLTLLAVSLTGLPAINRSLGYAAGNRLVAEAGRRLRRLVRAEDLAASMGQAQFAVAMENIAEPAARAVAARTQATLSRAPVDFLGQPLAVETLASIVVLRAGDDVERLLARTYRELTAARSQVA